MSFGLLDLGLNYPDRQAFYPISVRRNNLLPPASFRFRIASDTLAFGYWIPVIQAPLGLEVIPRTF